METWSFSHRGRIRPRNEDCLLVNEQAGIFAVCDGVGGHRGGGVASAMCIDAMSYALAPAHALDQVSDDVDTVTLRRDALHGAIVVANEIVHSHGLKNRNPNLKGMATTVVAAVLTPGTITICHVGDSRAYVLRGGQLFQLTVDHSMVEALVAGGMPRAIAAAREDAQVLVSAVGTESTVSPTCATVTTRPGDTFLLCSDGLYNEVDMSKVAQALQGSTPDWDLLNAALATRCRDNVTGIVVRL